MCLSCDNASDEPICSRCLSAIFEDRPLWLYPHTVATGGLVQALTQEAALSSDGTISIQQSYGALKDAIEGLDYSDREKEGPVSEYFNRLLIQMGVPLKLNMYEPIILLEEDKELIEVMIKKMEDGVLCGNRELCLRIGNILWHYGHGLKEQGLASQGSRLDDFFRSALKYYDRASSMKEDIVSLRSMAMTFYKLKNHAKSLEYCDRALEHEDAQMHLVKALNLQVLGRREEAITDLKRALELSPSSPMLVEIGIFLISIGRSDGGVRGPLAAQESDEKPHRPPGKVEPLLDAQKIELAKKILARIRKEEKASSLRKTREEEPPLLRGLLESERKEVAKGAHPESYEKVEETGEGEEEDVERVEVKLDLTKYYDEIAKLKSEMERLERKLNDSKSIIRDAEIETPLERLGDNIPGTYEKEPRLPQVAIPEKGIEEVPPPPPPFPEARPPPARQADVKPKPDDNWREYISKAETHIKNRKFKEALFCYDAASKLYPKNLEIWLGKAKVLGYLERFDDALKAYDRTLEIDSGNEMNWKMKISLLRKLGRFDEALDAYKSLSTMQPKNESMQNEMGKLLMDLERLDEAALCFNSITEKNPKNMEAHLNLGDVLLRIDRVDEAYECYTKAAEVDPKNAEAWFRQGLIQNKRGMWGAAIQLFNYAIALKNNFTRAWMEKANVLREHGELEDAVYCYDKAIKLEPRNERALLNKAKVLWESGKHKTALKCIETLLQISPKSKVALELRARIADSIKGKRTEHMKDERFLMQKAMDLRGEGKHEDALKLLALIPKINPKNQAALMKMAEILVDDRKFERALKKYASVLKINPRHKDALVAKGLLHMRLETFRKALDCFEALLRLDPGNDMAERCREECLTKLEEESDERR